MTRRSRSDRGSVTTEFVVISPILISFLCLVILVGRMVDAKSDIIGAANDAARVASLQSSAAEARTQAQLAATDTVDGERLNCIDGPEVRLEFLPNGEFEPGATIHVRVTCRVNTSDLSFIEVPLVHEIIEDAWEPIDAYRSR